MIVWLACEIYLIIWRKRYYWMIQNEENMLVGISFIKYVEFKNFNTFNYHCLLTPTYSHNYITIQITCCLFLWHCLSLPLSIVYFNCILLIRIFNFVSFILLFITPKQAYKNVHVYIGNFWIPEYHSINGGTHTFLISSVVVKKQIK